jgi:hypothetical protein
MGKFISSPDRPDAAVAASTRISRRGRGEFRTWNRKLHYYLGLYFLLFIWLFSVTGLLLNHSDWGFAEFWPQRRQSTVEREINPPEAGEDLAMARDILGQLWMVGEIQETRLSPEGSRLIINVGRPGQTFSVEADLAARRAVVEETRLNGWGVAQTLHTFTGVSLNDPRRTRDWALTTLWVFAMDALSVGLIALVLTGIYLWTRLPKQRLGGVLALALGTLCVGFFLFGLSLMS